MVERAHASAGLEPAAAACVANSSTAPASATRSSRSFITVGATRTAMPSRFDRGLLIGIRPVDDQAVDQAGVEARDRQRIAAQPELGHHLRRRPFTARPPMIGDTATTGAGVRRARRAAGHGQDRLDADERIGRADHDRFAGPLPASASARLGAARGCCCPTNTRPRTAGSQRRRHEIVLEVEPALIGVERACAPCRRSSAGCAAPTPSRRVRVGGDRGQASRRRAGAACAPHAPRVAVAEPEPGLAAELPRAPHESPGLVARGPSRSRDCRAPASVYISGVDIGRDARDPRCSKSSPVLATTSQPLGGITRARPSASLAPPTPPDSARRARSASRHRNRSSLERPDQISVPAGLAGSARPGRAPARPAGPRRPGP